VRAVRGLDHRAVQSRAAGTTARRREDAAEVVGEQRVPIVNHVPLANQKPIHAVGQLRATCAIQAPYACCTTPPICTRRVYTSITNSTK
jgi:hypothetical protein